MDQVKSNFFENQILEAIETVATGIVSKLQFDQTILCTITNDNKRNNGEYEVSDGSSTFKAFSSDTSYKKDMVVYVLVPQGDFERQKTIIGKYVDDTASAINYIPASQSIIEVAKIEEIPQNEFGLLANEETKLIPIKESDWDNTNIYDCVSLKANFKTDLSKYNIIDGDYGLILTLEGYQIKSETKEDGTLIQTTVKAPPKFYKFSCKDMLGDPYNYNIYFDQDIVFNLSENFADIKINHYRLDFYQDGKFKDLNGNNIPYRDNINNINFNKNLFVKDIQMSFGYSTADIKEEGIQIYTPDNLKYINRLPAKNIVLKWFQKNEIGNNTAYGIIDTIDEAKENNYSVYWYRYRIGASEDKLAGAFWELLDEGAYNDNIDYSYELIKDPDGKYTYNKNKQLILANSDTKQEDRYKMEIKIGLGDGRYDDEKSTEDPFNIKFAPDKLLNREKIKAILVKHEFEEIQEVDENDSNIIYITFKSSPKIYESNEIIFENANPANLSLAAVDLIKNMRLECADDSNGVYKLYNTVDNEIINNENTKEKILNVFFDTYSSIDIPKDDEQCKITWKIPKYNSMINPVNFTVNKNINKTLEAEDSSEIPILEESLINISWLDSGNYYICSHEWTSNIAGFDSVHKDAVLSMKYSIDKFYSQSYSNNTIICEIEKYGKTYTAEIEFIFGETGTNGTGYTVSLKLEKEYDSNNIPVTVTSVPCLTYGGNKVKVIASLFDEHGKDISEGKVFAWSWLNDAVGFDCQEGGNNYCYVQHYNSTAVENCYGILSATVAGDWLGKNVQLTGYLPLGIRSSSDAMTTYEGTTKIIYNEQGITPTYQKEHSLDTETTYWEIQILNDDTWGNFAPYFTRKENDIGPWILVARDIYFSDLATKQMVIHAYNGSDIIYSQSLLYNQNRFGNAMFNNWDGSLVVDKEENKILAAIIGAGKKDADNTFTGVVMGETTTNTGLFGYYQGIQTFGFNTDGTAFIGASGKGQIKFDGTTGTIESKNKNTYFDLDTGRIYLSNQSNGTANITIDSNNSQGEGYFSIKHLDKINGDDKQLIYIGPDQYYLQSKDYNLPSISAEGEYIPGTGVQLNLSTGKLIGYNFKIQAGQKDSELIINSDPESDPLIIGSNFKVDWNGKITATDGDFIGNITANTGTIGGWSIVENALYKNDSANVTVPNEGDKKNKITKYKAVSGSAIMAPEADVTISDLTAFEVLEYTQGSSTEVIPDGSDESITITEQGTWTPLKVTVNDIVFSIGKNFAINKDGTIYASGAKLDGIVYKDEVNKLSSTLINIAQGNLDLETYYRETADASEADARAEADNKLDGRIGTVNLNNNGLISQIGEYNDKSIFVDHTIVSGRTSIVEGYYGNETTFYAKDIGYETEITPLSKYQSYYDIDNNQYYKSYDNSTLTRVNETSADIDKDFVVRGYYYNGKIYQKKKYVRSPENTLSKDSSTIYLDIDTGLAYVWENPKFRLTAPEDNIVMFMVDNKGLLTAANAVIAGTIYAHDGYIGGWTIQHVGDKGGLTYGNNDNKGSYSDPWEIDNIGANLTPGNGLYIKNNNLFGGEEKKDSPPKQCIFNVGKKFAVDTDGILYARGGYFSGKITANEGSIGNWQILSSGHLKGTASKNEDETEYEIILNPTFTIDTYAPSKTFNYTYIWKGNTTSEETGEDDIYITDDVSNSATISFDVTAFDDVSKMQAKFITEVKKVDKDFTWKDSLSPLQQFFLNMQFIFLRNTFIDQNIFKIKNTNNSRIFSIDGDGSLNWRFYDDSTLTSEKNRFIIKADTDNYGNYSLNIGWVDLETDEAKQDILSFTSDGNLSLSRLKSTSYKNDIGGFQLYGEDANDKFWNNSLFTTNKIGNNNYVGFLRAVGSSSDSLSNVFIGCKQYNSQYWPDNNDWISANYNFYIRFDGKAKFETFHTQKWNDTNGKINYSIRPNEKLDSDKKGSYYLGTTNFPWDGLFLRGTINASTDGLNTNDISSSKGRDYALIKYRSKNYPLNYRPLFSIQGAQDSKTWDFGIDPYLKEDTKNKFYTDELLLQAFSGTAYTNEGEPSFSLVIGRRWNSLYKENGKELEKSDGYNYISPRTNIKLGTSNHPWSELYAKTMNGETVTAETYSNVSDKRLKTVQSELILFKTLKIYNNLNPIAYKYKNIEEGDRYSRTHIGFLAQDVEQLIFEEGLTNEDFAFVQISNSSMPLPGCEDGKKYYLNYNELHGLHVLKNQEQDKRILELEQKIQYLENKILELSGKGV